MLTGVIRISALENNKLKHALQLRMLSLTLLLLITLEQYSGLNTPLAWVVTGLAAAVAADGLRLIAAKPRASFIAFLLAQLCYSAAFWVQNSAAIVWWLPALLIAAAIVGFFLLLPQLERRIVPVSLMGLTLLQLIWAGGQIWLTTHTLASLVGVLASLTMAASAVLLAMNTYRRMLPGGQPLVSLTCLLSQALIVVSVLLLP